MPLLTQSGIAKVLTVILSVAMALPLCAADCDQRRETADVNGLKVAYEVHAPDTVCKSTSVAPVRIQPCVCAREESTGSKTTR